MQYLKKCSCGHMNIYGDNEMAPMFCVNCGNDLMLVTQEIYDPQMQVEDKPKYKIIKDDFTQDINDEINDVVEKEPEEEPEEEPEKVSDDEPEDWIAPQKLTPYIVFPDGSRVEISCSCVIGRTATGQHYLKSFPFVSKMHFAISPRSCGVGVTITDYSTFGTFINMKRLEKNVPVTATHGAIINLAGRIDLKLEIK